MPPGEEGEESGDAVSSGREVSEERALSVVRSVENDRARESTVGSAGMTDDQKPDDVAEEGDQIDYDPDDEVDIEINRTAWLFREFITLPTKE